jgi:HTH-type transcriptional regulator/antitoxin HipB
MRDRVYLGKNTLSRIKLTKYAVAYNIVYMSNKKSETRPKEVATRAPDQLGHAIARFRALSDLSQATLAQSAGLRQATISKVERGVGTTELQTIYSVCAALGLEVVLRPRTSRSDEIKLGDMF